MKPVSPYRYRVRRAVALQKRMAALFTEEGFPAAPRFVGGADIAFCPPDAKCADRRAGAVGCLAIGIAVVWDAAERRFVDFACAHRRVTLPYIPGLLSFREAPILRAAMRNIKANVDVWMFDGQGISHPRACGLAAHMGILADVASIGVAKSLLCGSCVVPGIGGGVAPVEYRGRVIALALRKHNTADPIYISQGNRCTLDQAVALVRQCLVGDFLPEPTHVADALSKHLRQLAPPVARGFLRALGVRAARGLPIMPLPPLAP